MLSSTVFFVLIAGCIATPLGELDTKEIEKFEKEMSREVEEEFSGKETQEELESLREQYVASHPGNETFVYIPTEIDINANDADLFEGDIVLTAEQWKVALDYDPENPARRRQGLASVANLWQPIGSPVIPYTFAPGFPTQHQSTVLAAMKFWEDRTCAKYRTATSADRNAIIYNHNSERCSSNEISYY